MTWFPVLLLVLMQAHEWYCAVHVMEMNNMAEPQQSTSTPSNSLSVNAQKLVNQEEATAAKTKYTLGSVLTSEITTDVKDAVDRNLHRQQGSIKSLYNTLPLVNLGGLEKSGFHLDQENSKEECRNFTVWNQSREFFESRLLSMHANFIQLAISFDDAVDVNITREAFLAKVWFWTYATNEGKHPYLQWPIDHGVLSFGLLSYKTTSIPYIQLKASPESCHITLGTEDAAQKISRALDELVPIKQRNSRYPINYFCYLAEAPGVRYSIAYYAALYAVLPLSFINYNCCKSSFRFENRSYEYDCFKYQMEKWRQMLIAPYMLGVLIALFFPILLYRFSAWLTENEHVSEINHQDEAERVELCEVNTKSSWIFLDGKSPLTVSDVFGSVFNGVKQTFPNGFPRIRRLVFILLIPSVIFGQILLYMDGVGVKEHIITMTDFARHGTPLGFLSVLVHPKYRDEVFVPLLGGPFVIFGMYFVFGIVVVVLPRSFKTVTENGLHTTHSFSPLFLGTDEIFRLALLTTKKDPGYEKAAYLFQASFCMLFIGGFWSRVFEIQKPRFCNFSKYKYLNICLKLVIYPFLVCVCAIEIAVCLVYYAFPLFGMCAITVKGTTLSMKYAKQKLFICIFQNPITSVFFTLTVSTMILCFSYCLILIFVESFTFICQIIMLCFVAVIVYPSVAFGCLFFCVVLVYYIVRLVRDFGDGYLALFSTVVEQSIMIESNINNVSFHDGHLELSNLRVAELKSIRINGKAIDTPQNVLNAIANSQVVQKVKTIDNTHGIPKRLFFSIVKKFRPVHREVLKFIIHITVIGALVYFTLDITNSFVPVLASKISDVMHVVFVVIIGALPRVLELAMTNDSGMIKKEIEERMIKQYIIEFWQKELNAEEAYHVTVDT
ncbi:uncharacterized protein LOC127843593 [Dreissena polymorpha]|uniref:uncharacterized protein LOC127843593 n=1 Tax=Dreissena polymorpha TaxID=45954 RepID=UPI0022652970|nr:uncharacterized protein LOC127843593 [Dreissena polymorpha]